MLKIWHLQQHIKTQHESSGFNTSSVNFQIFLLGVISYVSRRWPTIILTCVAKTYLSTKINCLLSTTCLNSKSNYRQQCPSPTVNDLQCLLTTMFIDLSAAWRSGSERRFYDDHDRKVDGSPPNLVSLLRPWIRCFTMIISAWWNLASSKLMKSEEDSSGKLGNKGNS